MFHRNIWSVEKKVILLFRSVGTIGDLIKLQRILHNLWQIVIRKFIFNLYLQ